MKKVITITIDEEVYKKSKEKIESYGGKISSLINKLLKEFNNGNKKINKKTD